MDHPVLHIHSINTFTYIHRDIGIGIVLMSHVECVALLISIVELVVVISVVYVHTHFA